MASSLRWDVATLQGVKAALSSNSVGNPGDEFMEPGQRLPVIAPCCCKRQVVAVTGDCSKARACPWCAEPLCNECLLGRHCCKGKAEDCCKDEEQGQVRTSEDFTPGKVQSKDKCSQVVDKAQDKSKVKSKGKVKSKDKCSQVSG